jgi:hypothetical protein
LTVTGCSRVSGLPAHLIETTEQPSSDHGEPVVEVVGFNPQLARELRAEQRVADHQGMYGDKCHRGVDVRVELARLPGRRPARRVDGPAAQKPESLSVKRQERE